MKNSSLAKYIGDEVNGLAHGNGVLMLENGIKKGIWENGIMIKGCEYIDDTLYVGEYDREGLYHGSGYYCKNKVFSFSGKWEHGKITCGTTKLPNCVMLDLWHSGIPYDGVAATHLPDHLFPKKGKIGRRSYGDKVKADFYSLPSLSEIFGETLVLAVESQNNVYSFSKSINEAASYFIKQNAKNIYNEAWLLKWENGDYAPLSPELAIRINEYIHSFLAEKGVRGFAESKKENEKGAFYLLDYGIYKGEMQDGVPCGNGCIVYNYDDGLERAFYSGKLSSALPNGYGNLYFKYESENDSYNGGFKDGLFDSESDLYKKSGETWRGVFTEGRFEGEDNTIAIGGFAIETYRGLFKNDILIKGEHVIYAEKYSYNGEFKDKLPHGYGTEKISETSWTGFFANGKRIIGIGSKCDNNALELYDPYVQRELCVQDFNRNNLALWLGCKDIIIADISDLSKNLGFGVLIAYRNDDNMASCSVVKKLFGITAACGVVLCKKGKDGEPAALSLKELEKLRKYLSVKIQELMQEKGEDSFTAEIITERYTSDWDVTRETHDDYPLEADQISECYRSYLLKAEDDLYYVDYYFHKSQPWTASKGDIDELTYFASASFHKLPFGNYSGEDLNAHNDKFKDYCNSQRKWTDKLYTCTYRKTKEEYKKHLENRSLLEVLVSNIFGRKMNKV